MKFSKFNVFTNINDDYYILSNTMTGNMFKVDENVKNKIELGQISEFTDKEISLYEAKGIIIDKSVDEYQKFSYFANKSKFNYDSFNLTLLLTNACNFKCTYCFQSHDRENNIMSKETMDSVFQYLEKTFLENKNLKKLNIILFGGEPLLKLDKYVDFLAKIKTFCVSKKYEYTTQIITNGSLINSKNLEILYQNNCRNIQITLDGLENVHNKTRVFLNGNGTFAHVINGIKLIKTFGKLPLPVIRINISNNNYNDINSLIEFLFEENLNDCYVDFGIIFDSQNSNDNNSFNEANIKDKLIPLWEKMKNKNFKFDTSPSRKFLFCGAYAENYITIDVDGSLYKCWDVVKNNEYKFGNINSIENISSDKYIEWINRDLKVKTICKECSYLPICGYGCANLSIENGADLNGLGCNKAKWLYDDQIKFKERLNHYV